MSSKEGDKKHDAKATVPKQKAIKPKEKSDHEKLVVQDSLANLSEDWTIEFYQPEVASW